MRQLRRSQYIFFCVEDRLHFDVGTFLRGALDFSHVPQILALSPLTGSRTTVSLPEIRFLTKLSTRSWSDISQLEVGSRVNLERLAHAGLVVTDSELADLAKLRHREELLQSRWWHPVAALFHFMDRESESSTGIENPVDVAALTETAALDAEEFIERHGMPPAPFHRIPHAGRPIALPLAEKDGRLYEVLRNRRTVRAFDASRSLTIQDLSTVLRYVFGCHGTARIGKEYLLLHKTSPSGGSLHPIEAYPLILDVESLHSGLYHYDSRDHSLALLEKIEIDAARALAVELSNGQLSAGTAHALVLMTARFVRNHWKYRTRSRTYGVILMDAGHLSQTLYLVAADLGLGAFYTAAVNGPRIEERLGLEAPDEGAIGICGIGVKDAQGADLGLDFGPFVPRETVL